MKYQIENELLTHLELPRFELRAVTDAEIENLPWPQAGCDFHDGRRFGVVKWIDQPKGLDANQIARMARFAAEHLANS